MIKWEIKRYKDLLPDELYEILKLRVDVFVVEQNCPYHEIDDKDRHPNALHLTGRCRKDGQLASYLRILPPGLSFKQVSIGRVVTAKTFRKQGLSNKMVGIAIEKIVKFWPKENIKIGAQVYLEKFYKSLGFNAVSEQYLEDGILHINMLKICS